MSQKNAEETPKEKLSRRGFPRYDHNPSIKDALESTKVGVKRLSNKTGDQFMIISDSGEVMAPAGFHQIIEVDKTQFIKLFAAGVRAFQGMTATGTRVFEMVSVLLSDKPGTDCIFLSYNVAQNYYSTMSYATFKRGIRELIEKGFLFEGMNENIYFVNVNYIFNGNRLAFIKEIVRKDNPKKRSEEDPDQLKITDLPNVM